MGLKLSSFPETKGLQCSSHTWVQGMRIAPARLALKDKVWGAQGVHYFQHRRGWNRKLEGQTWGVYNLPGTPAQGQVGPTLLQMLKVFVPSQRTVQAPPSLECHQWLQSAR